MAALVNLRIRPLSSISSSSKDVDAFLKHVGYGQFAKYVVE